MTKLFSVLVPLVNTNEVDSMLVSLVVKEVQFVKKDELMAVFPRHKVVMDAFVERGDIGERTADVGGEADRGITNRRVHNMTPTNVDY